MGWRTLTSWGLFNLTVNSIASASTYTSALPKENREFLAKNRTSISRSFTAVKPEDPEYSAKMNNTCKQILHHLMKDYPLAFSSTIKPNQYVDVPPVRIHVRKDTVPFLAPTARSYPISREEECKDIIRHVASFCK